MLINPRSKKGITKSMIYQWNIIDTDFMGFYKDVENSSDMLSYHHTRVAKCKGGEVSVHNGSILWRTTAHDYLHIIERIDKDLFKYLTLILIEVNDQGYLPNSNQLIRINSGLLSFEKEHCGETNGNNKLLIKESYTKRLIK